MPTLSIRKVSEEQLAKMRKLAKDRGIPYNSVEELLRREISKLTQSVNSNLPITLYMTPALPYNYVAVKSEDGSHWLISSTVFGPQAWANSRRYKGNYELERLPDYMARLYLPEAP